MPRFSYKLYDRKGGAEIGTLGGETIEADTKTKARAILARAWKRDTPRDARNCGFVPWSDVRLVWSDQDREERS